MVTDSDRLAAIRQRVEMIGHLADHIRVLVVEDVPWLLDRLAEAEARADRAERERDELRGKLPGIHVRTYEPCVLGVDGKCTRWSHDHSSEVGNA